MNEQRTPDELNTENELICEKLLGWKRFDGDWGEPAGNIGGGGFYRHPLPSFTTWADAGLILDALQKRGEITSIQFQHLGYCAIGPVSSAGSKDIPKEIRAAALKYIKAVE